MIIKQIFSILRIFVFSLIIFKMGIVSSFLYQWKTWNFFTNMQKI